MITARMVPTIADVIKQWLGNNGFVQDDRTDLYRFGRKGNFGNNGSGPKRWHLSVSVEVLGNGNNVVRIFGQNGHYIKMRFSDPSLFGKIKEAMK